MRLTSPNATRTVPLLVITAAAILFLLISYQYSVYTSAKIEATAIADIQSTTQVQAYDISGVLVNELQAVRNSLIIVAASPAVQDDNLSAAALLFDTAQNSSSSLTSEYFWVVGNGSLVLLSNGTSLSLTSYAGENLSQRPYFTGPENTGNVYYTSATPSLTNKSVSHVFVSVPLFRNQSAGGQTTKVFDGIVAASIDLPSLGKFLEGEISPSVTSSIGLVDPTGVILYSGTQATIGQNLFGPEIQSELPPSLRVPLDDFLNQSLHGSFGVTEISYQGSSTTLAYQPVYVGGVNQSSSQQFGVVYIIAPNVLAGNDAALISNQRVLGLFIIVLITGLSVAAAVVVLGLNRRLDDTVKVRTADLTAANERLSAYARAQTDFVNIAAHELRTPTQSIVGYAEILEGAAPLLTSGGSQSSSTPGGAGKVEGNDVKTAIDSILRNAKRLKKLTDDILSASRIDTNGLTLDKERFDLNALIKNAIAEAQGTGKNPPAGQGPIDIAFNPESPVLVVDADTTKIGEVMSNLLSNAIKFSSPGGKVIVSTSVKDGKVVVSVKDNGTGISRDIMPNLFNKFATNSPSGTGLGLFISKNVVEAHGGTMWAINNEDGRGSTFTFTLPLNSEGEAGVTTGSVP